VAAFYDYDDREAMKTTLTPELLAPIVGALSRANAAHDTLFPGDFVERQPVHTVYGGAHLFKPETPTRLGSLALDTIRNYASDSSSFADCVGLPNDELASKVFDRTVAKLQKEPIEDFRIDFEDGYGNRPDAEEDGHAISAAQAMVRAAGMPGFPPFIGIRIKSLTEALRARAIRTLDLFLTALLAEGARVPQNFAITLPKVTLPEQVTALVQLLEILENRHKIAPGTIKIEIMIETPQLIVSSSGSCCIPQVLDAAQGRCRGLHFGPYDYLASCNIASAEAGLTHPACDFARQAMQVSAAGRGVMLSDGPTNILPVPRHRAPSGGSLTAEQISENRAIVRRAMRLHFENVQRSLSRGFYQGWDLHPGQLVARYAAVYAFFLHSFDAAAARLKNFVEQAARATLVGDVFDDAATGQGLLNFFLRGINCVAFTENEAARAGVTVEELRSRSFLKILNRRRAQTV
jgi:citrate lyase beta subunit